MKRNLKLPCLTLCLALSACGGDSNNESSNPGPINPQSTDYLEFWKTELTNINSVAKSNESFEDALLPAPTASEDATNDYSETNIQVAGVDELDSVKFDGEFLLSITQNSEPPVVSIFSEDTLAGNSSVDTSLFFTGNQDFKHKGLLTHDNYVVSVGTNSANNWLGWLESMEIWDCFNCNPGAESIISLDIWQYKNAQSGLEPNPTHITLDGSYVTSRSIENKVYIFSRYTPYIEGFNTYPNNQEDLDKNQEIIDSLSIKDITPNYTINGTSEDLLNTDCQVPESYQRINYYLPSVFIITEVDIFNPSNMKSFCLIGHIHESYIGKENIYLLSNNYNSDYNIENVSIRKISFSESGFEYKGEGTVRGSLSNDGYSLAEVDGKFAMVNTVYPYHETSGELANISTLINNNLFYHQLSILDESENSLQLTAQIPNENRPTPIGKPDERLYAVRFMKERAYVVTFDKVDPLYVIDLSNSNDPKIIGELEIPGFSDYLHVIEDNLLFGIGKNAINDGTTTWYQGLNIRLFDISDPSNPTSVTNINYGLRGSESPLLSDPHSLAYILNKETGIARLSFPVSLHGNESDANVNNPPWHTYDWNESALLQLEIDTRTSTMKEISRYVYASPELTNSRYHWSPGERSVINNNMLYFVHDTEVTVLDWGSDQALRTFSTNSTSN